MLPKSRGREICETKLISPTKKVENLSFLEETRKNWDFIFKQIIKFGVLNLGCLLKSLLFLMSQINDIVGVTEGCCDYMCNIPAYQFRLCYGPNFMDYGVSGSETN